MNHSESHPSLAASAVICTGSMYLFQLRDLIPAIDYPGYVSLFGGHIEPGEDHSRGVEREVREEVCRRDGLPLDIRSMEYLGASHRTDVPVIEHFYHMEIVTEPADLEVTEGTGIFVPTLTLKFVHRLPPHACEFLLSIRRYVIE